ncbi:MAG: hypothetical protein ORN54_01640 [Cyclobacteriaceae bacterium]|nr:hypothetical protein [Cyclobacteriaceae bacterium]
MKDEDIKPIKDSYFNLLSVFFEEEHIRGSHMRCILKWGAQLRISEHDIDVIGRGLHAPYVPPASEIDRLESVYHLVHMIYLDQKVDDSELEIASVYASRLGFSDGMVGDLFKSIATIEFDRTSPEDVRKEVIDFLKLQKK